MLSSSAADARTNLRIGKRAISSASSHSQPVPSTIASAVFIASVNRSGRRRRSASYAGRLSSSWRAARAAFSSRSRRRTPGCALYLPNTSSNSRTFASSPAAAVIAARSISSIRIVDMRSGIGAARCASRLPPPCDSITTSPATPPVARPLASFVFIRRGGARDGAPPSTRSTPCGAPEGWRANGAAAAFAAAAAAGSA